MKTEWVRNKNSCIFKTNTMSYKYVTDQRPKIYLPKPKPWPLPVAWNPPNGLADPKPFPDPVANPPFCADAIPTPVAETPPGPAFALPNPAPLPEAGLKTERW